MVALFFVQSLLLASAVSSPVEPFIVGGQDASIEKYPSLVQVEFYVSVFGSWVQQCGANILTSYWVLSAAHCFDTPSYTAATSRIRAGATYRHMGGSVHYFDFERNHPDYDRQAGFDADISVVKLLTPLVYSPTIQQGTIVIQDFVLPDNFPVVFAGWGLLKSGGASPHVLQDVSVNLINRDICSQRYGGIITSNMICAGALDVGGLGACQGDSGGPLYAGDVIVGVTSFSMGCADAFFPSVSASVAAYSDWIVANAR